jgi:branched-chain amino acid aminotransferase
VDEALMLDVHGHVSTCNSTNFFMVKNSQVWTSTGEYCLNGVTRGKIIQLCQENDIPVFQKNFLPQDVHEAEECFVTGTFAGVIPVIEVDGHVLSHGERGPFAERLQKLYHNHIETRYSSQNK